MNKDLFSSMQKKLTPSQQAVDQLKERLTQAAPAGRRPIPCYPRTSRRPSR